MSYTPVYIKPVILDESWDSDDNGPYSLQSVDETVIEATTSNILWAPRIPNIQIDSARLEAMAESLQRILQHSEFENSDISTSVSNYKESKINSFTLDLGLSLGQ